MDEGEIYRDLDQSDKSSKPTNKYIFCFATYKANLLYNSF
jgi:hypothetical protein